MKKTVGSKHKWEWDIMATTGYNIVAKFEETLINFGLLADYSDITDTEKFDKKYGLFPDIGRARDEYSRFSDQFKYTNKPDEGSCGSSVNLIKRPRRRNK